MMQQVSALRIAAGEQEQRVIALAPTQTATFSAKLVEGGGQLTLGYDFGFSATFQTSISRCNRETTTTAVVGHLRGQEAQGEWTAAANGSLTLLFDNAHSWFEKDVELSYAVSEAAVGRQELHEVNRSMQVRSVT
eukprot:SAG31_NODE_16_length_36206_cov_27.355728_30_plen_135_part_00